jgi:hypothetical protein
VTYTELRCTQCGHLESDHIVEDDNSYCLRWRSDQLRRVQRSGRPVCLPVQTLSASTPVKEQ